MQAASDLVQVSHIWVHRCPLERLLELGIGSQSSHTRATNYIDAIIDHPATSRSRRYGGPVWEHCHCGSCACQGCATREAGRDAARCVYGAGGDGDGRGTPPRPGSGRPADRLADARGGRRTGERQSGPQIAQTRAATAAGEHRSGSASDHCAHLPTPMQQRDTSDAANARSQLQARHGQAHAATICGEAVTPLVCSSK